MPRVARFKIAAINELLRQLEYAPAETRARHMDAAERLIGDIDPGQNYPQEYIVFRITGYRSDQTGEPVTFVGQALLPDLVNLVQTLSENLGLPADYAGRQAISMPEVAARLRISGKTIQRYRKQGLVCHYVRSPNGMQQLACFEDALARFAVTHSKQLDRAAAFTRVDGHVQQSILQRARELHQAEDLSLNETAQRLAIEHGRAHETIRMMLRRHDRRAAEPIFSERGPLTERDIRLIHRAWQWGIEPARLAQRFGKTKPTIHRAVNRRRRDLLRSIDLPFIRLPTFDLPDAAQVILSPPAVTTGLHEPAFCADALALIGTARAAPPAQIDAEHSLLAAYNLLKMRAATAIAALATWPGSEELDAIETDLQWASMLRSKLIMLGFPPALQRIEQNLHRPLTDQPADRISTLVKLALEVATRAVEVVDPGREQRLERIAGYAMERALAKLDSSASAVPTGGRAAARHQPGSILIGDWNGRTSQWDSWLELRSDLQRFVLRLDDVARRVIALRYGLEGMTPLTLEAIAGQLDMKHVAVVKLLARAQRELRALARAC